MTTNSFAKHKAANARLVILRALAAETDRHLNDSLLVAALEAFGHHVSRDYVRTQLRALDELGAVTLHSAGSAMVAELLQPGLDHVERRAILEGVQRPSLEG